MQHHPHVLAGLIRELGKQLGGFGNVNEALLFHGAWVVLALVTYRIEIASRRERRSLIAMG